MQCYGKSVVGASGVNADSFYISADKKVFAVADGASGAYDKVAAGKICTEALSSSPYVMTEISASDYIRQCITTANENLTIKSKQDGKHTFGTLTAAVIDNGVLTVGAVGDTPAYLIQGDKAIKAIKPKRRYQKLIEFGVLTEGEITKAISLLPNQMWSQFDNFLPMIIPDIAIAEYQIHKDDVLIICTDGISDCIEEHEFIEILKEAESLEAASNKIYSLVDSRCPANRLDDRTIIIARL